MDKGVVLSFLYLLCFQSCRCGMFEEPRCSKYDFEEKVLEKLVRLELKMETMTESVNEISTQVKDDINKMKAHMADMTGKIQAEWTDIKETIQDDWTEIRKEVEMMKGELVDREKMLNDSIQKTLTDLSAKIQTQSYAFSAHDLTASTPTKGGILMFPKTLLNEDGVYSTTTGKFTAPCDGVYEFHSTLASNSKQKGVWVEFKAGDLVIGRFLVLDYGYIVSSSGSAIARLRKGTEVYLRVSSVSSGFRFQEDLYRMNTFSGHLISH